MQSLTPTTESPSIPSQIAGSGGIFNAIFGGDDDVSLRSRAFLNVLYLLSEGEIAGFPATQDIRKYIYVNDTPIINPDGTENFRGVRAEWRSGTQLQNVIAGTRQGTGAPVAVNTKVTFSGGALTRSIATAALTDIRITLFTPGLQRTDDEQHTHWSRVDFKIYLSTAGGPYVLKVTDKFEGKTAGGYARDYTLHVDGNTGPWSVKVERTNPDVPITNTKEQNDLYWQSYTSLVEAKFRYPNSALLFVRLDTAYFKSQPTVTVKLQGMICRIPSNYNPTTRIYTGIWNGTFTRAYTNNPAWCLLELLTNKRFGTGNFIDLLRVDKWSFYRVATYCDELVSDGQSGSQPRFVYNHYLRDKQDAFAAITTILSQIRAIAFYSGGQITIVQDRPGLVSEEIFNPSNVVQEYDNAGKLTRPPFVYDYVSLKEKHSRAHVSWYDPNEYSKKKTAYVDLFDIGYGADYYRYGDEAKEVDLPGCTSEAEAKRHGKWLLATERLESRTISFATGSAGLLRTPGSLIRVSDPHRQQQASGRILSGTGSTVTLDRPVTLTSGTFNLIMSVGGVEISRTVTNAAGTYTTLNISPSTSIPVGTPWILEGQFQSEIYRVLAVSDGNDGTYGIFGVLHSPIKAALADFTGQLSLDIRDRSNPLPPTNLTVSPIYNGYFLGWKPSPSKNVVSYDVEWEEENSNRWTPVPIGAAITDLDIILPIGIYRFRVAAVSLYGTRSTWLYSPYNYATTGKVISHFPDGGIKLNQIVNLKPGVTYYIDTFCENPAGVRPNNLPVPYKDRRLVTNPPQFTDIIYTSPSYLGDILTFTTGSYPNINPLIGDRISYLIVTGTGSVTVYKDINFAGANQTFTAGYYRADYGQLASVGNDSISSLTVDPGTQVVTSQHEPGRNPVAGSIWVLGTTPVTGNPGGA